MTEKPHILVVEDDLLVSEVIAAALDDRYLITIVETSDDAARLLRDGGFQLMLLDCTLPGGIDRRLIPESDRVGTAVLLMSGDPGRAKQLSDRLRPFLLKPFTLTGLLAAVDAILTSHASGAN